MTETELLETGKEVSVAVEGLPVLSEKSSTPGTSSPSEKHGWRVFGGMMGPVQ